MIETARQWARGLACGVAMACVLVCTHPLPALGDADVAASRSTLESRRGLLVPVVGTVRAGNERVSMAGLVDVTSTLILDPDFGTAPKLVLAFHFRNVFGTGLTSGREYVIDCQVELIRMKSLKDVVEVSFPIAPVSTHGAVNPLDVAIGTATFTLSFDIDGNLMQPRKGTATAAVHLAGK